MSLGRQLAPLLLEDAAHALVVMPHAPYGVWHLQKHTRKPLNMSPARYAAACRFHSDSAVSFAMFLNQLPDLHSKLAPQVLLRAMEGTIATISRIQKEAGVTDTSLLNFVVSRGRESCTTAGSFVPVSGSGHSWGQH